MGKEDTESEETEVAGDCGGGGGRGRGWVRKAWMCAEICVAWMKMAVSCSKA